MERDKAKKLAAPKKRYDLDPGDYAGSIGGEFGTIHVPESGSYETTDPGEQSFIEQTIGREGKSTSGSARSGSSTKE